MHLLFLGVAKATRQLIHKWISDTKRLTGYNKITNDIFKPISDMGLEWCKLLVANSGWVSDNYIAFTRICKWYYYPILTLQEKEVYQEPNIPIKYWYVKMCKDWLTAHGDDTSGRIDVLKARIIALKEDIDNPPVLKENICCSVQAINNLIGSLVSMISSIMKHEVTDESIDDSDREIKLYLSNLNIAQNGVISLGDVDMSKKSKPLWLSKYNFLSLLNIPQSMKLFGPMINLWEGSNQGEGYLRFAKPKLTNIHSKNWQINAHLQMLNEMSFDEVIDSHMEKNYVSDK